MSSPTPRPKSWRSHVSIPGRLAAILPVRWSEFGYTAFSPYAIELVCYDLRIRAQHDLTLQFAKDTPEAQDAIDREIGAHYQPGTERDGVLIKLIFGRTKAAARDANEANRPGDPPGLVVCQRMRVFFPGALREIIELRWSECGYESLSAYLTALIRYDLMLGGPHGFDAKDSHPDLLAALDAATYSAFHERKRKRILLDYLVEEAAGRKLSDTERQAAKQKLGTDLLENSLRSQKAARRAALT